VRILLCLKRDTRIAFKTHVALLARQKPSARPLPVGRNVAAAFSPCPAALTVTALAISRPNLMNNR
jgi:hypothetical protein